MSGKATDLISSAFDSEKSEVSEKVVETSISQKLKTKNPVKIIEKEVDEIIVTTTGVDTGSECRKGLEGSNFYLLDLSTPS